MGSGQSPPRPSHFGCPALGGAHLLCKGDCTEQGRILQLSAASWEHLAPVFQKRGREGEMRKEKVNAGYTLPLPARFISGSAYMRGLAY